MDIELLVEMDQASDNVCGPATAHLLKRAYRTYGDERYLRLSSLSVSHLYNLRKSAGYQARRRHFTKTNSRYRDFTPTTALNTSTPRWPNC